MEHNLKREGKDTLGLILVGIGIILGIALAQLIPLMVVWLLCCLMLYAGFSFLGIGSIPFFNFYIGSFLIYIVVQSVIRRAVKSSNNS